jgi:DNA polymerase-3 subunit chi
VAKGKVKVNFYQVAGETPSKVDSALPSLLNNLLDKGHRVVLRCPSLERRDRLNNMLWDFIPESFLPHGVAEDGRSEKQPVFLTCDDTNPNNADICIAIGGVLGTEPNLKDVSSFTMVLDIFNSSQAQTKNARLRWKHLKEQEADLAFFAQIEGKWQKKV